MSDLPRILIVDNSRVVRASLAKHLQGHFEVRQEANGEAAWQTLVLDSHIVAVIAGSQISKLDGYELVERLRESRLHRLKDMPFLLIVSDTESEEGKSRAKSMGVSDFITKLMGKEEILARLNGLLDQPEAAEEQNGDAPESDIDSGAILKRVGRLSENPADAGSDSREYLPAIEAHVHLLSSREIEERVSQALASSCDRKSPVSVLALGIDNFDALAAAFGHDVAKRIGVRFARLLTGKIGLRDCISLYRPDCCLIVSRHANLGRCYTFAGRVCRSVAAAQIAVRGQPADLAICAGAASAPEDGMLSASELLALAISRMEATRCACHADEVAKNERGIDEDQELPPLRSLVRLLAKQPDVLGSHLGTVGLQLLPLFNMLEREFGFGLPLPEMESRLAERARLEEALSQ